MTEALIVANRQELGALAAVSTPQARAFAPVPPRKKRVLHVVDHLGHGGAQVLLVDICTSQAGRTSEFVHEVLVLHGDGLHAERLRQAHVPLRRLAEAKTDALRMLARLSAHISRHDYDLLHLHLGASSLLGATLAFAVGHTPVVSTVYSLREQHQPGRFFGFKLVEPFTHHYITLWENDDLPGIGVGRNKISVIPIGIDVSGAAPERHAESRAALCAQYGVAEEQPLLLSVARLHADRKIHVLVEAMAHLVGERPDAALIMVGDGEERERLEAFVAKHGLERNVIFAGARADVWGILPGCDVYLSSSGRRDTGVAAMQAMACERPVVTYTIAPESMAGDEQECAGQGVFLQTRDAAAMARATLRLLADPPQATDLGRRGREAITGQFALGPMVERYEELYLRLINR